jgi:acyl-CoA thioester hydrolase
MSELPLNVSRVRVRMYHTDLVGVFHGRIFELFEEARTEAFRRLGFEYRITEARGIAMVVTHVDAAFARPLRMDEELEVGIFISHLSRVRVAVEYEVRTPGEERPSVTGHTTFAFFDTARARPVPVPPEIRAAIERCLGMLRTAPAHPLPDASDLSS